MFRVTRFAISAVLLANVLSGAPALAQTFNSGSTGAHGAFNPTSNTTLALPPDGVFHFTTINIPTGVTVTFARNATNTPVTLLAAGDVMIAGTIDVSGSPGGDGVSSGIAFLNNAGPGGPGGFDGGRGTNSLVSNVGGSGLGPGGGEGGKGNGAGGGAGGFGTAGTSGSGGNFGAANGGQPYGTPSLLPLIGGSGGGGGGAEFPAMGAGSGGGGGALVVASSGTITFTGTILARGGNGGGGNTLSPGGGGSGGAIRLVATTIVGSGGTIDVAGGRRGFGLSGFGGFGGIGRVRIEAFDNRASLVVVDSRTFDFVQPSVAQPTSVTLANAPTLRITAVGGVAVPDSPTASFSNPDIVLPAGTTSPVTVNLAGSNIPPGTAVTLTVKGQVGGTISTTSTLLSGTLAASTATASVTIPTDQPSVLSASATFTLTAANGGPLFAEGEEVRQVRVLATYGGQSRVAYVTKSGREIWVAQRQ